MAFNIDVPCKDDAAAVADTHLRAMESNTLLHAKFPDAECQTFLRESLQKDTLDHIADNQKRCILVARDPETGSIISFVKWLVQRQGVSQDDHAEEEQLPETCRSELFYSYLALTKDAREEVLGDKSYYRKSLTQAAMTVTGQAATLSPKYTKTAICVSYQMHEQLFIRKKFSVHKENFGSLNLAAVSRHSSMANLVTFRCDISLHRSQVEWPRSSVESLETSDREGSKRRNACHPREHDASRIFLSKTWLRNPQRPRVDGTSERIERSHRALC